MERRLKIAVNTRFLIPNKLEGIGLFTAESTKRIVRANPHIDFYFLFDRAYSKEFIFSSNVRPVVLFPPARHPLLWWWWFELSVARWLNKNQPDLFLSADGYACLRSRVPQVLVLHDLSFEHFSKQTGYLTYRYYKYFMPRFAQKAARIATVSEFSKNDIATTYHISPHKIDVVYNGAKEVYRPAGEAEKETVRRQYTSGKDFFLYVGAIHPRKNIRNLLLAFEHFKTATQSELKLLLVGRMAWDFDDVERTLSAMQFRRDVVFTGHVPPEKLGQITAAALAMVYVSLFEGFGIPLIEAMSCDVPVITSTVTAMPEVAGDAALLVPPDKPEAIAAAMTRIAGEPALRRQLIAQGREQSKKFSWDKTAEKLWRVCQKTLSLSEANPSK